MSQPGLPLISDYGLIGNCRTAALISRQGSLDWCCFPSFDSPSYFSRLLDPAGGHFSIAPNESFHSEQAYLNETNILNSRFKTDSGSATLSELFTVRDFKIRKDELRPDQEILRVLEVHAGEMAFDLEFFPRSHYGLHALELRPIGNWGFQCTHGRKLLLLQTSLPGSVMKSEKSKKGPGLRAAFTLRAGERMLASLTYADEAPAVIPALETAPERFKETQEYWQGWSARCNSNRPKARLIQRSALALKLLNFAPSGAFIAAPTTSLPENLGGTRNWDYRFCWLRDAAFTTRALLALGYVDEAKSYLSWLLHSTRLTWPKLQVLYTVYGEAKVTERIATWLRGFQGSRPVRFGNEASTQSQLDVYGEVIDSFYSLAEFLKPIDQETKKMVIGFGSAVAQLWDKPDHGIWEFRSEPKHYTHSKVMCWVAMDRLAKLSERFDWRLPYNSIALAATIRAEIEANAFSEEARSYTRAYGDDALDASLLVMPLVGYCDASNPRFLLTQDAIIHKLAKNGLIYRYPPGSDGIREPEGAFTLCNLWLSETLAMQGRVLEAERWLEAVTAFLPPTGLASEEMNPATQALLGNFPQGFSHIGLIHSSLAIQRRRAA